MAKSYTLSVRALMAEAEAENIRIYYAEYPPETVEEDRLIPDNSSSYVERAWIDYADKRDPHDNRLIDILELGVFVDREVYYTISASLVNAEGDESELTPLETSFKLASPPQAPESLQLIVKTV